eukprot:TRINITY_DN2214_c0_g1_i2.p1 TRINITY_DN2214_c0_g1~~TRINITY_DN2214_c0_g1_i2.p1  ORF type:complete len:492 (+),score=106.59 TRINITY_DN2214_c0_g1_i2:544-2019(+)
MFKSEVLPVLRSYRKQHQQIGVTGLQILSSTSSDGRKRRQGNTVLKQLVNIIGESEVLYNYVLALIRTIYNETGETAFCTLRNDLLMIFHDKEMMEVIENDRCKKFIISLDTAIQDYITSNTTQSSNVSAALSVSGSAAGGSGYFDPTKAYELEKFIRNMSMRGETGVLNDLSMITRDPYALGTILDALWKQITNKVIVHEELPRADEVVVTLTRLLHLATTSRGSVIKHDDEDIDSADSSLYVLLTQFYPVIVMFILQNQLNQPALIEHDSFLQIFLDEPAARKVALFYGLMCARQKDPHSTIVILDLIAEFEPEEIVAESWFFQSLIRELTQLQLQIAVLPAVQDAINTILTHVIQHFAKHISIHREVQQHIANSFGHCSTTILLGHLKSLLDTLPSGDTQLNQVKSGYITIRDKLGPKKINNEKAAFFVQWLTQHDLLTSNQTTTTAQDQIHNIPNQSYPPLSSQVMFSPAHHGSTWDSPMSPRRPDI